MNSSGSSRPASILAAALEKSWRQLRRQRLQETGPGDRHRQTPRITHALGAREPLPSVSQPVGHAAQHPAVDRRKPRICAASASSGPASRSACSARRARVGRSSRPIGRARAARRRARARRHLIRQLRQQLCRSPEVAGQVMEVGRGALAPHDARRLPRRGALRAQLGQLGCRRGRAARGGCRAASSSSAATVVSAPRPPAQGVAPAPRGRRRLSPGAHGPRAASRAWPARRQGCQERVGEPHALSSSATTPSRAAPSSASRTASRGASQAATVSSTVGRADAAARAARPSSARAAG